MAMDLLYSNFFKSRFNLRTNWWSTNSIVVLGEISFGYPIYMYVCFYTLTEICHQLNSKLRMPITAK